MNSLKNRFAIQLTILSFIGLVAAFWQTAEKIHILANPGKPISCNLNPVIDCGQVLNHPLSSVLGVSNSLLGVVIFTILVTLGILILGGIKPNIFFKRLALMLASIIFMFAVWFFTVSLYEIHKVCIFCIFIWAATAPLFVLTVREYLADVFSQYSNSKFMTTLKAHPNRYIVAMYALALTLYLIEFRDYYFGS